MPVALGRGRAWLLGPSFPQEGHSPIKEHVGVIEEAGVDRPQVPSVSALNRMLSGQVQARCGLEPRPAMSDIPRVEVSGDPCKKMEYPT